MHLSSEEENSARNDPPSVSRSQLWSDGWRTMLFPTNHDSPNPRENCSDDKRANQHHDHGDHSWNVFSRGADEHPRRWQRENQAREINIVRRALFDFHCSGWLGVAGGSHCFAPLGLSSGAKRRARQSRAAASRQTAPAAP